MIEASIIIPTYNRAAKLHRCLQALCSQTYPAMDFEVIVVIDGSTDETLEMVTSLETPFSLRVIPQPNRGQSTALNRGVTEALGRICIFLDDDITVTPQFLAEHLSLHNKRDQVVGIGQINLNLRPSADWFARGFAQGWSRHYTELNQGKRQPDWEDCYGGNMSVSRTAFLAVGGNAIDLRRGYDIELAYRLWQSGCSFEYLPDALGEQYESKSFLELSADAELAGEASAALSRCYPFLLPRLLGNFRENRLTWILLWHLFLSFNLSAQRLESLQRLLGKRFATFEWFPFFYNYCFWKGARHAIDDPIYWSHIINLKRRNYLA